MDCWTCFGARLARLDEADGDSGGADDTKVVTVGDVVVHTTGFHGELSCEVTLPRLSSRATAGVAFTLPRGLVADRDDVRSKTIDGWLCDAFGDVDIERPASRAGASSVVCVKELTEGRATARSSVRRQRRAHDMARRDSEVASWMFISHQCVWQYVVQMVSGCMALVRAVGRGKFPWETRDAAATKIVGTVANALGACIVILAAYVRARGEKIKVK